MRNMPIFSVSSVAFFASSVVIASSLFVELLVLPVRHFSRALCFGVLRSIFVALALVPFTVSFFVRQFFAVLLAAPVAMLTSNFTLKRDFAEARRTLAPRWADKG